MPSLWGYLPRGLRSREEPILTAGVDEAGRGPVVGPMILAGVVLDGTGIEELRRAGVRDSKELSRDEREKLYYEVEKTARHVIIVRVDPVLIDSLNLNVLEHSAIAFIVKRMIEKWGSMLRTVYIDSVGPANAMVKSVREKLAGIPGQSRVDIVVEKGADRRYVEVAAASIVAKVVRDTIISRLEEEYGRIGSGYPHDPVTRKWIRTVYETMDSPPPIIRRTWSTLRTLAPRWYIEKRGSRVSGKGLSILDFLAKREENEGERGGLESGSTQVSRPPSGR